MRVTYRYPALVTSAKPRSETVKGRRIVPMLDHAEISEYSSADIAVAAILPSPSVSSNLEFRFHDGQFYKPTDLETFDERSSGLEQAVAEAIGDYLIDERAYKPMIAPYVVGRGDTAGTIWSLWRKGRQTPGSRVDPSYISEKIWAACKPFDADTMKSDLLERWSEVARDYVTSLLLIDGKLWVPTKEPMMRSQMSQSLPVPHQFTHDDASCYLNAYGRPSGLPQPYGSNGVRSDAIHLLHPYWDTRVSYLSLPQANEISDTKTGWLGDVLLPEAFTVDHETLQLDRAARLAVCFITHLTEDFVPFRNFIGHQKTLKRLTKVRAGDLDFDVLAEALVALNGYISPENGTIQQDVHNYIQRFGIRARVTEALDRWQDRAVDIALPHYRSSPYP